MKTKDEVLKESKKIDFYEAFTGYELECIMEVMDDYADSKMQESKIKDKEQLIYDLRKFADKSPYLSEINKVGANEIINFFHEKT